MASAPGTVHRKRIAFFVAWLLLVLTAALPAHSQTKRMPRVAFISNAVPLDQMETYPVYLAFKGELTRLGWTPGRNVEILWRSREGDPARVHEILDDLLRRDVDVIVLGSNYIAGEAQKRSRTVAIVTTGALDPVGTGLAREMRRPGGNITGVLLQPETAVNGKRLALFRELLPRLTRLAVFSWEHPAQNVSAPTGDFDRMARGLGITFLNYRVKSVDQMEAALVDAKSKGAEGAMLDESSIFKVPAGIALINAYTERQRMPLMHTSLLGVEAGGLIAYSLPQEAILAKAAQYVDRILKGAKPGDLPFEQVGNFSLHVNKKAARAIGLTIPGSILVQADKVYE